VHKSRPFLLAVGPPAAAACAVAFAIWMAGSIPRFDVALLGVMACLAVLAGLTFYVKTLPLALTLATELHRQPAGLWVARYWRLWPTYLALATTGWLTAYAFERLGIVCALAVAAVAFLFRYVSGKYVDRTLDSVRKLRTTNEQLQHQAFHDPLTSLANRALFAERLQHAMVRSEAGSVAVLFLDLDNFKHVNDKFGHAAGDELLVAASERLLQCVRREDTIARLGGDEFIVLLEDMRDPSDAARMAERMCASLRTPFAIAGHQVCISSSIGIALDSDRGHHPDDLMREADMAMYRAKSGGKARYEIFDTRLGSRAMERLELETELRQAVARCELMLYYQPVVDLASGSIEAVEALMRWNHPRHGLLLPAEFLNVAEETGMIVDLGRWALEQACRDAAQWQWIRPGLVVQVNVSPEELDRAEFTSTVAGALAASRLPANCLLLEIPESGVAPNGNGRATAATLETLRALGVRLALDDVGGGASSLAWLSRLPVDVLKIGAHAVESPALVRASVALGGALGMTVTAQGLDRADQATRLAAFGCQHAQGYFFGAPQPAAEVSRLLGSAPAIRLVA
jgi:diguanylate cyclase (GGDEF)-like protein